MENISKIKNIYIYIVKMYMHLQLLLYFYIISYYICLYK